MPKLWLPPAVWFQGSQQHRTGGSSPRNGSTDRIMTWFEHSIRWVLMTPFGRPVDPDVNKTFAIVSAPTRSRAASTAADGSTCRSSNEIDGNATGADVDTTKV